MPCEYDNSENTSLIKQLLCLDFIRQGNVKANNACTLLSIPGAVVGQMGRGVSGKIQYQKSSALKNSTFMIILAGNFKDVNSQNF